MTEFDNFLEKTERILEARRAAVKPVGDQNQRNLASKADPETLQQLSSLEWSKLLVLVMDQTTGKSINKDRFLAYGRTGVMVGKIILMLKPGRNLPNGKLQYYAEYRSSSAYGDVIKLAEVIIEPELACTSFGEQEITWNTVGLDERRRLASVELAMVLAMKLVDVYQSSKK